MAICVPRGLVRTKTSPTLHLSGLKSKKRVRNLLFVYYKCSYFLGPSMLALLIVPKFCVLSFYLDSYRHLRGFFQPFIDVKLIFPKICPKIGYWKVNSGSPSKNLHDVFV